MNIATRCSPSLSRKDVALDPLLPQPSAFQTCYRNPRFPSDWGLHEAVIFDDIVTLLLKNDAEQSPTASEELLFKWRLPVDMMES